MPRAAPNPPLPRRGLDLILPLLLLGAGTAFFRLTSADLDWTAPYCEAGDWPRGAAGLWGALYHFGTIPALLTAAAAVFIFIGGFRSARLARLRRPALYLILLLAIGPGLVTNAILKDHWGRPRPREVDLFGGREPFEKVLTFHAPSRGKSFPCGHATMGFFFFGGYYLFRRRNKWLARAFVALGAAAGGLIGWARVVQGGHFPSDVLWAGGLTWLVAAALARLLRPWEIPGTLPAFRPARWGRLAAACLLLPALVFAALLATPIETREERGLADAADITLRLEAATLTIQPGSRTAISLASTGFGLPGSGIRTAWSSDGPVARVSQRRSGLATELSQRASLSYDPARITRIRVAMPSGRITLTLPPAPAAAPPAPRRWDLSAGAGQVVLRHNGAMPDIDFDGRVLLDNEPETDRVTIRSAAGGLRAEPPLPAKLPSDATAAPAP